MKKAAHEKLAATPVAREFVRLAAVVLAQFPRGEGELRSQLRRAADSVLLNLCEGAGRWSPRDKARFYDMSVGSATECLGALDCVSARGLASPGDVSAAELVLRRVIGMVTGLAKSARDRADRRRGGIELSAPGWQLW